MRRLFPVIGLCLAMATSVAAEDHRPSAARGYELLRTHQYLPPDFDDEVFAALWTTWPEPDRSGAEKANPSARRKLTFSYYGLIPSPEDTDGTKPALSDPEFRQHVLSHIPLGRIGDAIDVAGAVVFLASPAASLITGANILVDGGWSVA